MNKPKDSAPDILTIPGWQAGSRRPTSCTRKKPDTKKKTTTSVEQFVAGESMGKQKI